MRDLGRIDGTIRFPAFAGVLLLNLVWVSVASASASASAEEVELRDPQEVVAELPIRVSGAHEISVPVFINKKGPFDFIVDTGATSSGVYRSVVLQNDLRNSHIQTINVSAADGLVRLRILEFEAFRAAVFALTPPHLMEFPDYYSYFRRSQMGLLGADYLTRHVVVFDFPRDMMVLYPKKTNLTRLMPRYFDAVPLQFSDRQNALFVKATIGRKRITALVDTGAAYTTILASQAPRLGISLGNARQIVLSGINGNRVKGYIVTVPELRTGRKVWKNVEVVFAEFTVRRSDNFAMLLGMDLMGQTPFAIDYGRQRLLLARPDRIKMVSVKDPRSQALVPEFALVPEALECSFPSAALAGLPCVVATRPPARP